VAHDGLPPGAVVERVTGGAGMVLELACLPLPITPPADHDDAVAEIVGLAGVWVAAGAAAPILKVPLHGTHLVWSPGRAVAIGSADRLDALRSAVVDFTRVEAEVREIERRIASGLEHVDADASVAFVCDEAALPRRRELADRFREAVSLRRRLAVLAPAVHQPAPQPPTLAGQMGERLRDRSRLAERLDHAVDQADLLERVYAGCGDRVAEFVISRRHATLEWVIILLLVAEVLLFTVDLLARRGS
jgi:hypothetical protein